MSLQSLLRLAAAWLGVALLFAAPRVEPPKRVLWSWFGETDLRFLKGSNVGVAYLALSLSFEGQNRVIPYPRFLPLRMSPQTWQMAVVRFDYDGDSHHRPAFSEKQRRLAVKMIAEIAAISHAQAIQVDFDAPRSAYPFYRRLLTDVRKRLGSNVFLSMTALVSWCEPRSWMAGLPVDEIVPMAFYMGRPTPAVTTMLERGASFAFPGCRGSIGVELDTFIRPRKNQRVYFFAQPQQWSPATVRELEEIVRQ
jgi:hypothetical protein